MHYLYAQRIAQFDHFGPELTPYFAIPYFDLNTSRKSWS